MRYCTYLAGLALSIEERTKQTVVMFVANSRTAIPELLGIGLIGDVVQKSGYLSVLDLVKDRTSKLKIIALLIDLVGATAGDVDAFFNITN
jgi:hypothetical protein